MFKIGDVIQWTINGVDQFSEPKKVRAISNCGDWVFVDGSNTGLPKHQISIVEDEEKYTFFYSGPFSQWHRCRFMVDGQVYCCAEQYMMACKAKLFGDMKSFSKIMASTDPSVHKKIGREVSGFDPKVWNAKARDVVYAGNHAKFTQNPTLLKALLDTRGTILVEASPVDKIWGIGRAASDPRAQKRSTWNGSNWLGETLTRLREDLIREDF